MSVALIVLCAVTYLLIGALAARIARALEFGTAQYEDPEMVALACVFFWPFFLLGGLVTGVLVGAMASCMWFANLVGGVPKDDR